MIELWKLMYHARYEDDVISFILLTTEGGDTSRIITVTLQLTGKSRLTVRLVSNLLLSPVSKWVELITFTRPKRRFGWRDSADCKKLGTKWSFWSLIHTTGLILKGWDWTETHKPHGWASKLACPFRQCACVGIKIEHHPACRSTARDISVTCQSRAGH